MSGGSGSLPPIKPRTLGAPVPGRKPTRPAPSPWTGTADDDGWGDVASGSKSGAGDGGRGGRGGRGAAKSPPLPLIVGAALIVPFTLWLGPVNRIAAVLVGMFAGVVLLGIIRLQINARMQGGRYADWPVPAAQVATIAFVLGWLAGLVSLWDLAIDFSRRFT
jgi:hypothetical protein